MTPGLFDPAPTTERRFFGVYSGKVVSNADPLKLGRIKVSLPWVAPGYETAWARPATPMSGAEFGVWFLPEVGDEVLLAFDGGDPGRPIVIGGLWNQQHRPPVADVGANDLRLIRSRSGHTIEFNDSSTPTLTVRSKSGHEIVLEDTAGDEFVAIQTGTGDLGLVLNAARGEISLTIGGQTLSFTAGGGSIVIKASSKLEISAAAGLSVNNGALEVI